MKIRSIKRKCLRLCLLGVTSLFASNASTQVIVQIASDGEESFFVKSDGSLWRGDAAHAMAKHSERRQHLINELKQHPQSRQLSAQLREEDLHITSDNFEPVDLIISNRVAAVAMNGQHETFFIKDDGSLWAVGNSYGKLSEGAVGGLKNPAQPFQIMSNGVTAVACGEVFTIFLKIDGSLWGFGWNGDGQLGNGDGVASNYFGGYKRIVADGVVAIAAGYAHSLFIRRDGSLWGMGNNVCGQLGLGSNLDHTFLPVEIVASNVVSIAAAHYQSLFIKKNGSLWGMGLNNCGQIGDCTIDWPYRPEQVVSNNVVAITAGYSGSLFLKQDGSLWGMGINWGSDYGEGIEFDSKCPMQIFGANTSTPVAGYYYSSKLKTCASVWAGKFNTNPDPASSANNRAGLQSNSANFPGYNLITIESLQDEHVRLTYFGNAGVHYALERSSSLANPKWVSLITNKAPSGGTLVLTNKPETAMNNFWRIRSVP